MIRFSSDKWEGLDGMGDEILREMRPRAENLVTDAGNLFVSEIKVTLTGRRTGRTYKVSKTGALHVASAPGEPPAVLFDNLRGSIGRTAPKWEGWEISTEVGVGLGVKPTGDVNPEAYGQWLEYGTSKMAPRPYLRPSQLKVEPRITALFEAGL